MGMSSLIGHTLADPPHVCWKRGENKREVQGTGVGTVLGKPALPPFGQFSVCVKWSLKEAAELELSCRSPTQRGKSLLGGAIVWEPGRSEETRPKLVPPMPQAPATHGGRGGGRRVCRPSPAAHWWGLSFLCVPSCEVTGIPEN